VLGVAFACGHLNNNAQGNDESSNPGYEMVLEATYQIVLTPWLSFQPDLQYVMHPSGTDIANALVLGARATISFCRQDTRYRLVSSDVRVSAIRMQRKHRRIVSLRHL
jgi:hypothetical protein